MGNEEREWDVNVFYEEVAKVDDLDYISYELAETLTIEASVYVLSWKDGREIVNRIYPHLIFKCDKETTNIIRSHRPDEEWGSDWWETRESLTELPLPDKLVQFLTGLPDPYKVSKEEN
jgi:hypothetical protein